MSKNKQVQKRYKKLLLTLVKLAVSIGLILFVFSKIDTQSTFSILKSISPTNLILGFLLVLLSKIIASYRLLSYFRVIKIPIQAQTNLQLYFLGMFYNLFLPGGIGGDAYKAYILKKHNPQSSSKKTIAVLVLDRISGLFALFTIGVFVLASLQISILNIKSHWSILLLVVALLCYKFIIDKGFEPLFAKAITAKDQRLVSMSTADGRSHENLPLLFETSPARRTFFFFLLFYRQNDDTDE